MLAKFVVARTPRTVLFRGNVVMSPARHLHVFPLCVTSRLQRGTTAPVHTAKSRPTGNASGAAVLTVMNILLGCSIW